MKIRGLLLALVTLSVAAVLVPEVRADGFQGRSGMPWFAYGNSGSLYGLGRLPVPPYFAIHPPVYYSLPQARPYGHSPFAYSGEYQPPVEARPRLIRNRHIETLELPAPVESPAETSTARVIANPYYQPESGSEASLASQAK